MTTGQVTPLQQITELSVVLAGLLIGFGLLAMILPRFASVAGIKALAWLVVFDGFTQLAYAFRSAATGRVAWKFLVALLYVALGVWLSFGHLRFDLAGLTLLLAAFFLAEGVLDLIGYLLARKKDGSSWMLVDGIITISLAVIIWRRSNSFWVLAALLGVSMLMTGTTRLMIALAVRKGAKSAGDLALLEHSAE